MERPVPGMNCPAGMKCPCYMPRSCPETSSGTTGSGSSTTGGGMSPTSWLALAVVPAALLAAVCAGTVLLRRWRRRSGKSQQGPQDHQPEDRSEHPAWAAISFEQLDELRAESRRVLGDAYQDADMHAVVRRVIQPRCHRCGKSWARIVNEQPLLLTVFVSHCWAENFDGFVRAVEQAFACWTVKPHLWICATALYQSADPTDISAQVGTGSNPEHAFFTRALSKAQKLLIVRNSAVDLYQRIWCCWELYLAYEQGMLHMPGAVMVVGPASHPSSEQEGVDIRDARASNPEDKESILNHVLAKQKSYRYINSRLSEMKFFRAFQDPAGGPEEPF